MNDEIGELLESSVESIQMPAAGLYVNVDVNDLLMGMSQEEVFDLVAKLKDLLAS